MKNKEIHRIILESFTNSEYKWRTIKGVSKETKIPEEQIRQFLDRSKEFIKAKKTNSNGQALYSLRNNFVDKVISTFFNRPENT